MIHFSLLTYTLVCAGHTPVPCSRFPLDMTKHAIVELAVAPTLCTPTYFFSKNKYDNAIQLWLFSRWWGGGAFALLLRVVVSAGWQQTEEVWVRRLQLCRESCESNRYFRNAKIAGEQRSGGV